MARIRSIKPDFWTDEKVVELSAMARLLFIGLWNFADDEGRMIYSPKRSKLQIFPADDCDISALFGELRRVSLISVYTIGGVDYLQISGFSKHQKIDKRQASKLPAPDASAESRRLPPTSADFPRVSPPDQGRDQGMEGIKEPPKAPPRRGALSAEQLAEFDGWYSTYPHKVSRGAAEKAWPGARKLADMPTLIAGLEAYKRQKPADIPWRNPATWLNGKGWLDAPSEVKPNGHDPADADRARFSALLRGYKPGGNWPEVALGPRPESGQNHRIPQDLLAEWRAGTKRPTLPPTAPNATSGQNTGNGGISGGGAA